MHYLCETGVRLSLCPQTVSCGTCLWLPVCRTPESPQTAPHQRDTHISSLAAYTHTHTVCSQTNTRYQSTHEEKVCHYEGKACLIAWNGWWSHTWEPPPPFLLWCPSASDTLTLYQTHLRERKHNSALKMAINDPPHLFSWTFLAMVLCFKDIKIKSQHFYTRVNNSLLFFTWMVKVVLAFQSFGLLFWSENPVETVLADDSDLPVVMIHLILTQKLHDFCTHCGLTGENQQLLSSTDESSVYLQLHQPESHHRCCYKRTPHVNNTRACCIC